LPDADPKKAVQVTQDYVATLPTEKKNIVLFPEASGGNGTESP